MRRRTLAALFLLAGAACPAYAGLFSDDEAHRKIAELQQQVAQHQQQTQQLEARLASLEAALRAQGLDLLAQLEAVRTEMAKLNGQAEVHAHDIEAAQKRQRDLYADIDGRLRQIERAAAAPPAAEAVAKAEPVDAAAENRAYDAASSLFKAGNYVGAIAEFQNFLRLYPSSSLAPAAQYWIGNAHFALRDFQAAIASQQKLLSTYGASPKAPDAMLNIASSQLEVGDSAGARKTLEALVAKHPTSAAAELARKRLANLK